MDWGFIVSSLIFRVGVEGFIFRVYGCKSMFGLLSSYLLLPVSCFLPPASYLLPTASCFLTPASCFLPTARCFPLPAFCILPSVSCQLPTASLLRASVFKQSSCLSVFVANSLRILRKTLRPLRFLPLNKSPCPIAIGLRV